MIKPIRLRKFQKNLVDQRFQSSVLAHKTQKISDNDMSPRNNTCNDSIFKDIKQMTIDLKPIQKQHLTKRDFNKLHKLVHNKSSDIDIDISPSKRISPIHEEKVHHTPHKKRWK